MSKTKPAQVPNFVDFGGKVAAAIEHARRAQGAPIGQAHEDLREAARLLILASDEAASARGEWAERCGGRLGLLDAMQRASGSQKAKKHLDSTPDVA